MPAAGRNKNTNLRPQADEGLPGFQPAVVWAAFFAKWIYMKKDDSMVLFIMLSRRWEGRAEKTEHTYFLGWGERQPFTSCLTQGGVGAHTGEIPFSCVCVYRWPPALRAPRAQG